jgi:2-polyprenyl-6-methoxyphenol hydroxylase-like FAD-dependent oxidoreductase
MGLLPVLQRLGYVVDKVQVVDRHGRRIAGFPAAAFSRATHGRYLSLSRGDLASTIYECLKGGVETIFGDSIEAIRQTDTNVHVTFRQSPAREFDLVVGADGLHSRVREIVFGPERRFEKYLGLKVAAFEAEGYRPRDELTYVMYTEVGRQIARFPCAGIARCSFLPSGMRRVNSRARKACTIPDLPGESSASNSPAAPGSGRASVKNWNRPPTSISIASARFG